MRSLCSRLLGEPILHFAAIGAGLFALHALVAPAVPEATPTAASPPAVVIRADRVAGLAEGWRQAWGRPPTAEELDRMVEDEVRAEVLAHEATVLGLDRDDEFIRQHLRERMEVIADGSAVVAAPTEAELEAFYAARPASYGGGTVVAFRQVPLDPARRGAALHEDAASLLRALQAGEVPDPLQVGDPMDPARTFDGATTEEIATLFGPEFVAALLAQAPGTWAGPIASGYGLHLVLVEEVRDQPPVPFDEVREAVAEDWAAARAQEQRERFYQDIRQRYVVQIERLGTVQP